MIQKKCIFFINFDFLWLYVPNCKTKMIKITIFLCGFLPFFSRSESLWRALAGASASASKRLWSASLYYRQGHCWVALFSPSAISGATWRGQLGKNEIFFPLSSIPCLELSPPAYLVETGIVLPPLP